MEVELHKYHEYRGSFEEYVNKYIDLRFLSYFGCQIKKKVAAFCVGIHTSVSNMADKFYAELRRKYYITPKSYLDCVNLYIVLLDEKRKESIAAQDRFLNGLNKLKETNELIATMKVRCLTQPKGEVIFEQYLS